MAKLRPKLSTVEIKDLAWWFSAALVGGGIPNIIVGLPRGLSILIGMAAVAAIILAIQYFKIGGATALQSSFTCQARETGN